MHRAASSWTPSPKVGASVRLLACSDLCWCYPLHFTLMLFYVWLLRSGRPRLFARLKEGHTLSLVASRGANYSSRCIPPSDTGLNASCSWCCSRCGVLQHWLKQS